MRKGYYVQCIKTIRRSDRMQNTIHNDAYLTPKNVALNMYTYFAYNVVHRPLNSRLVTGS